VDVEDLLDEALIGVERRVEERQRERRRDGRGGGEGNDSNRIAVDGRNYQFSGKSAGMPTEVIYS